MVKRRVRGKTKSTAPRAASRRSSLRRLDTGTDVQTSYFFMLNCLLHSRVHTGIESNSEIYDEDVNVYLAHLLNAQIDPKHLARIANRIAAHDAELFRMIADCGDDRQRYELYRCNADFLLMSVAVFDTFELKHSNRLSPFHTRKDVYGARAAAYYGLAASYATKLGRRTTPIAETLTKLSEGMDSYVRILTYMRGQYLDFIKRYSDGEIFHLERSIDEIRRQEMIEERRNAFLDIYHAWLKTGERELKERLAESARLLEEVDPTFTFDPPS
jgi:hypothetical protein